jgi:hypothetical protein
MLIRRSVLRSGSACLSAEKAGFGVVLRPLARDVHDFGELNGLAGACAVCSKVVRGRDVCHPEKRVVDSSILSLTTRVCNSFRAAGQRRRGSAFVISGSNLTCEMPLVTGVRRRLSHMDCTVLRWDLASSEVR